MDEQRPVDRQGNASELRCLIDDYKYFVPVKVE
jgi:hypothetical protein